MIILLADLAPLAIAGKNRVAGRRRIVVGESIILTGNEGDGHGALQGMCGQSGFGGPAVSAGPD